MAMDRTAFARQLSLFDADSAVAEVDMQRIIDEAHRLRMIAIRDVIHGVLAAFKRAYRAAGTRRRLNGLNDSVLADIGVERDRIPEIARALAAGEPLDWDITPSTAPQKLDVAGKRPGDDGAPELPLAA